MFTLPMVQVIKLESWSKCASMFTLPMVKVINELAAIEGAGQSAHLCLRYPW